MTTEPIMNCVTALTAVLEAQTGLQGKVLFVFDQDDLIGQLKGVQSLPAIGIVYEGMRAMPEAPGQKTGASAEMVFSLVLVNRGNDFVSSSTNKTASITLLDSIRQTLISTRSPTGSFWNFVVEAAAAQSKGVVFWVQRWSVSVGLAKRN